MSNITSCSSIKIVFERRISTGAFRSAVCPFQILDRWYTTLHTTTYHYPLQEPLLLSWHYD